MANIETITKTKLITPNTKNILDEFMEAFYAKTPITIDGVEYLVVDVSTSSGIELPPNTLKCVFVLAPVKNYPIEIDGFCH